MCLGEVCSSSTIYCLRLLSTLFTYHESGYINFSPFPVKAVNSIVLMIGIGLGGEGGCGCGH